MRAFIEGAAIGARIGVNGLENKGGISLILPYRLRRHGRSPSPPLAVRALPIGRGGSPNGEPPGLGSRNWARTLRTGGAARGARNGEDGVENQRARESKRDFQEEQNFLGPPLRSNS